MNFRGVKGVAKVAAPLLRGDLMNVFLHKLSVCEGKLPAPPGNPADTIAVLQTAKFAPVTGWFF